MQIAAFVLSVLVLLLAQLETAVGASLRGDDDPGARVGDPRASSFRRNATLLREYGRYKRPAALPAGQLTCAVCSIPH